MATAPVNAAAAPARHRTLAQRFELANTTHDGRLTLEQARSGHMNAVVRDFAAIDTANRGFVTLDEIKAYRKSMRQAHRAAKPQAQQH